MHRYSFCSTMVCTQIAFCVSEANDTITTRKKLLECSWKRLGCVEFKDLRHLLGFYEVVHGHVYMHQPFKIKAQCQVYVNHLSANMN